LTEEFRFVVELRADSTLDELASIILDTVHFDGDHLSEFYLANGLRGRKKTWLTADGEWDGDDSAVWARRLLDIFPIAKNKVLYYEYDAGSAWRFEIIKKGKEKMPLAGHEFPQIVEEHGNRPLEYGPDEDDDDEDEDEDKEEGVA
jgi:hypothetical protein